MNRKNGEAEVQVVPCSKPFFFPFEGTVPINGICLGDIDDDGFNEVIVASQEGKLSIFKGTNKKPVYTVQNIGTISCLAVGDILHSGSNCLIVICWDGLSVLFQVRKHGDKHKLESIVKCQLAPNIKSCFIDDTYADGESRITLTSTDNVLSTYKWEKPVSGSNDVGVLMCMHTWQIASAVHSLSPNVFEGENCLLFATTGGLCYNVRPSLYTANGVNTPFLEDKCCFELTSEKKRVVPESETFVRGSVEVPNSQRGSSKNGYSQCVASAEGLVAMVKDGQVVWRANLKQPLMNLFQIIVASSEAEDEADEPEGSEVEDLSKKVADTFLRSTGAPVGDSPASSFDADVVEGSSPREDFASRSDLNLGRKRSLPLYAMSQYSKDSEDFSLSSSPVDTEKLPKIPVENKKLITNFERYGVPVKSFMVAVSPNGDTFFFEVDDGHCYKMSLKQELNACTAGFYGNSGLQQPAVAYAVLEGVVLEAKFSTHLSRATSLEELLFTDPEYLAVLEYLKIDPKDREAVRQLNDYLLYGYLPEHQPFTDDI